MKNLFYDHEEKVYIEAVYKGGRFIDAQTGRLVILRDGVQVRIAAPIDSMLNKEEENRHKKVKRELLLTKGSTLAFHFYYGGISYDFRITLLKPLFLEQKGNHHSKLVSCKCVVFKPDSVSIKDFEADSLNQAFMKTSIKYRPNNKSHTCNVFKTFYYKGRPLEELRNF